MSKKAPGVRPTRSRMQPTPRTLRVSGGYREFVLDQLSGLGDVTAKAMFGGVGLYWRDLFFAIIARDVLYFKTDPDTVGDYEQAGMGAFRPYADRPGPMRYHEVPTGVLEDPEELLVWARRAVGAARRARGV